MELRKSFLNKRLSKKDRETLDALYLIKNEKKKELDEAQALINDFIFRKSMPFFRKKYNKKFFKCINTQMPNTPWEIYTYCHHCVSDTLFSGDRFQFSAQNVNDFKVKELMLYNYLDVEITEKEYKKALRLFQNKSKLLLKSYGRT